MPSSDPTRRFADIIENIDAVRTYTEGMTETTFRTDRKTVDATERCLSRISEGAIKLGPLAEEMAPDQPWDGIRGIGNVLRHEYPQVSHDIVWEVVTDDLGPLCEACERAIRAINSSGAGRADP